MDDLFPVVETPAGRVRGLANAGVGVFRGIPYGEDTGGAWRWQPPRAKAPWTGLRDAFTPGPASPQVPSPATNEYAQLIHFDRTTADGGMGEDCLSLNVWTPLVAGTARPVIVVIHGGGYAIGSGNAPMYDGAQMAARHDVVVVSLCHRLGAFGFLGLAGERFGAAGHCGLLDLVLALEWVRDAIGAFGGDAGRVTIIGQSGGGWKVGALMAMPAAVGLFHRAVVQSGSWPTFLERDEAAALAERLLGEIGVVAGDTAALLAPDFVPVLAAQARVMALAFQPVLDPEALPDHPYAPAAIARSAHVPLIVSTTLEDAGLFFDSFDLTEADYADLIARRWPDHAAAITALYAGLGATPYLRYARLVTDAGFRRFAHEQLDARGAAPTWAYRWDWPSPAWDGRFGAAHAIDVSASLANPRDALIGAGTAVGRHLADALSARLAAFAATGTPQTPCLPDWPVWTPAARETLILDAAPRIEADPDAAMRRFWAAMPRPSSLLG